MTDEYVWPARNVAEYAYCPRLFYLMEVEGLHLSNVETEQGQHVHRRVDKPTGREPPVSKQENAPSTVRSLTLTDESLQLTATLDLTEIESNWAVPVEYRRGIAQRIETPSGELTFGPWPTDRVQIGLQAILLEKSGFHVSKGVLYYAAENRKIEIAIDEAIRQEAMDTLHAARQAASGPRPEPLLNDSRCPRCSLQPLCLPDEIHFLRGADSQTPSPRKIWPPRDDGIVVVAQDAKTRVGVSGKTLRISGRDGKKLRDIALTQVESLSVVGAVQVSTQALHALAERGTPAAFLSSAGRLITMTDPMDSVSAVVRKAQCKELDKPAKMLQLSKALVRAKILNQRVILQRNLDSLGQQTAGDLAELAKRTDNVESLASLRGLEGQAAAIYFKRFPDLFNDTEGDAFRANGRKRRPPPDPINACLSLAYTMLAYECVAALRTARLEPAIGAYHVSRPGRPALALDLMEPFRPLVADSLAITAFNKRQLTTGHFNQTAAGCVMTSHGRRAFFGALATRMATEITHPVYGYRLTYRRMIILHARLIAAWMLGEVEDPVFLTTR